MNGKTTGQVLTKKLLNLVQAKQLQSVELVLQLEHIKKTRGTKVVKQSFGEKIVDIAYAPFIRKNTITFTAKRVKTEYKNVSVL